MAEATASTSASGSSTTSPSGATRAAYPTRPSASGMACPLASKHAARAELVPTSSAITSMVGVYSTTQTRTPGDIHDHDPGAEPAGRDADGRPEPARAARELPRPHCGLSRQQEAQFRPPGARDGRADEGALGGRPRGASPER